MMEELAMENTVATSQTPNDILASEITDALVAAGLITNMHKWQLLAKLKSNGVTQEDWNLWIDMATAPQVPPETNNE